MKKISTIFLGMVVVFVLAISVAQARSSDTISFGYKSAELTPYARTKLESLSLDIKHLPSVQVVAYAPQTVGDPQENTLFANKRGKTVMDFLVEQGVPASIINVQTVHGPATKSRMVEINYGATSTPVVGTTPPPPAPTTEPAVAAAPPPAPAKEPVITAEPEKEYESGLSETSETSDQPFLDPKDKVPSRWNY